LVIGSIQESATAGDLLGASIAWTALTVEQAEALDSLTAGIWVNAAVVEIGAGDDLVVGGVPIYASIVEVSFADDDSGAFLVKLPMDASLPGDVAMVLNKMASASRGMVAVRIENDSTNLRAALRELGIRRP
jgi:hypothetical protein